MLEQEQIESIFDDTDEEVETIGAAFTPMRFDVMQRKVRDLLSDYNGKDLDPRPSFQRGYVWDKSRASKLIESILLNVPLPLIYTAEEDDDTEVVIDGQQRLMSVFCYIQGKFPKDDSVFKLSGLKLLSELNGKTFSQLDEKERKGIERYIFQIIRISKESHADVKFEIFERLNSGSVTLNAQELRNCVYRGKFNEILREFAEDETFRKILGSSTASGRMQDAELVLRFLAFYERTYLNYQPGMKSFLNNFMEDYRDLSNEKAEKFRNEFKHAVQLSYSVFGENSFRKFSSGDKRNPNGGWERAINRPLFDLTMWGFTRFDKNLIMANADQIRESLVDLLVSDSTFLDWITSATGDKTKTQYRFELWHDTLKNIVSGERQPRCFPYSIKKRLFERDSACAICKQQILHIDDAQVDHIKPFSAGGETDETNAQITHRYCNQSKSNKQES